MHTIIIIVLWYVLGVASMLRLMQAVTDVEWMDVYVALLTGIFGPGVTVILMLAWIGCYMDSSKHALNYKPFHNAERDDLSDTEAQLLEAHKKALGSPRNAQDEL